MPSPLRTLVLAAILAAGPFVGPAGLAQESPDPPDTDPGTQNADAEETAADPATRPDDSPPAVPDGYRLLWHDEFNEDGRPDPEVWGYERGFVRNHELQYYRPQNARVEGGCLVIEAKRERVRNERHDADSDNWRRQRSHADYTSACVKTNGRREWQYGRLEVRARIDVRTGMWPAIWTLGTSKEWPSCGEVDVMECYSGKILANGAWGTNRRWQARWDGFRIGVDKLAREQELTVAQWAGRFHVWRMDWDADRIVIRLDGRTLNEIDVARARNADGSRPFRQPHYLLLNLAIGSNGGDPSGTEFPARYEVDWVRVYQPVESPEDKPADDAGDDNDSDER